MIIKKPYAFLIKYFRIIHLVLLVPIIYLISKTNNIVTFFKTFVANNYSTNILNITGEYISILMYIAILLIIFAAIAIFYLMKQKNKSTNLYLFTIIYYAILLIFIIISGSIMNTMQKDIITAQAARAYRDISQVMVLPQYFFAIYMIIRGIGFDIKKFNFANDLKDLEISDADKEEVELSLNLEGYRVKRSLRRYLREFIYYVKENKLIFSIIAIIIVIVIGRFLYLNIFVYNQSYVISDKMNHNNFHIEIADSILTNLSYDGSIITPGKYYLVIKLNIENTSTKEYELDYNNFRLVINDKNIYPVLDRGHYFVDLGKPYQKEKISGKEKVTYVLTYELEEQEVKNEYSIRILDNITYSDNEIKSNYKTINLTPKLIKDIEEIETIDLGKILTLQNTTIGYTTFQITSSEITNGYTYEYQKCYTKTNCQKIKDRITPSVSKNTKQTLLILNANYNFDTTTNYYKSNRNFISDFVAVRYTINNEKKVVKATNRTTKNMQNIIALEVPKEISEADDVELLITIRNNRYIMKLK